MVPHGDGFMSSQVPEASHHFQFSSSAQAELYRGLSEIGPAPAEFFRDACQIMAKSEAGFATAPHLVAHLLREVNGFLVDVFASPETTDNGCSDEGDFTKYRSALKFLGIAETSDFAKRWKELLKSKSGAGFHARAHRAGLDRPRLLDTEFQEWFGEVVSVFGEVISRFRITFLRVLEYVDSVVVLQDPPRALRKRIPNNYVAFKYFFERVTNPRWLPLLRKRGFFVRPPSLLTDEQGITRAIFWPQAEYIGRMAQCENAKVREEALEIMLEVSSTDNYLIHADFAKAAIGMPIELAARWAEPAAEALRRGVGLSWGAAQDLGRLSSKLAQDGHAEAALKVASALLDILPDQNEGDGEECQVGAEKEAEVKYRPSPEPRFRCDPYEYKEILKATLPSLVKAAPTESIEMFCGLLEKAMVLSARVGAIEKPRDFTCSRRPAIEDHGQNSGYGAVDPLITALRDATETTCRRDPEKVESVVEAIEAHGWDIFRRIAFHLLRVAGQVPAGMVEARLVNSELFDNYGVHHEYFHLLKRRFPELTPEGQATILAWIDSGDHHRAYLYRHEKEWSVEQRESNLRYWQYNKLLCIKEHLRGERAQKFEELEKEFGEPAVPPDFHSWMGGVQSIDLQSPKRSEELGDLSVEALVDFLKSWKPPGDFRGPSREGLGGNVTTLVAGNPVKYAVEIEHFEDEKLAPLYLAHVVSGFVKALEGGKTFPLELLFRLCSWVVSYSEPERCSAVEGAESLEENWARPRQEIASMFSKIFEDQFGLPFEFRDSVWRIIEPLTNDPDPDPAYEERYGGENMDPLSISINSVRGNAMHGVIRYALWVCRKSEAAVRLEKQRPPSLAEMPEVQAVLDAHLDARRCQFALNQTDRAVYGDWLPQLTHIDSEWVGANLPKIFPATQEQRRLREAAWKTYVLYTPRVYKKVFELIGGIYREEVSFLKGISKKKGGHRDPEEKLVEHVVVIYAWGWDGLAPGSLVDLLFANASDDLKAHAISFVGRNLRSDADLGHEIVGRFKDFWEWRAAAVGGAERLPEKELGEFGWWFASGRCGEEWAFSNLEKVLARTGDLPGKTDVFEHVSKVFDGYPMQSLRCLKLFVEKNQEPWFFNLERRGGVWEILRKGMAQDNAEVRAATEEVINLLASKGYLQYRELLRRNSEPQAEGDA